MELKMKNHTVTIACPVSNRAEYLPFYLDAILKQTYPKELTNLLFVANNVTDNSIQILKKFKQDYLNTYPLIRIEIINNQKIPDDTNKREIRAKTDAVYV
jgi:glycosyltransferase involved in cell wall biosynthesis